MKMEILNRTIILLYVTEVNTETDNNNIKCFIIVNRSNDVLPRQRVHAYSQLNQSDSTR